MDGTDSERCIHSSIDIPAVWQIVIAATNGLRCQRCRRTCAVQAARNWLWDRTHGPAHGMACSANSMWHGMLQSAPLLKLHAGLYCTWWIGCDLCRIGLHLLHSLSAPFEGTGYTGFAEWICQRPHLTHHDKDHDGTIDFKELRGAVSVYLETCPES